jgi:hypothetical protein
MDSSSRRADESNYDHLLTYSDRRTGYGLSQHGYVGDEIYNLMINGDKSQLQLMNDHKDDHGYETISLMYESDNESLGDILEIPIKENVKTSINYDDPFNGSMNYKDDIPDSKGENQNENFEKEEWFKPIYEVIGSLRYLADRSRPDLLYPVNYLSRFMVKPNQYVLTELNRLLMYIQGTKDMGLIVGGNIIDLQAMVDSSFVYSGQSKSQMGYGIYLCKGSGCISSFSKRATTVALSTTQAETDSLTECIKEIFWFRGFLRSIGIPNNEEPTITKVDCKPAITLTKDGNPLKRSKYYLLKLNWIIEQQNNDKIKIQYVPTEDNHSDIFTKGLSGNLLMKHTVGILGIQD